MSVNTNNGIIFIFNNEGNAEQKPNLSASQELVNDFVDLIMKTPSPKQEFKVPKVPRNKRKPLSNAITKHRNRVTTRTTKAVASPLKQRKKPESKWSSEEQQLLREVLWGNPNLSWEEVSMIFAGKFTANQCKDQHFQSVD